ncbi:DUF4309 domain-containing protein [Anaerobacillus sp. CMMVII]|uniref:YjgB family protein n=1 Tax=Anaerobacillus sp. CMMVII TaxID=2755588 RepID=UPI0021B7A533|nr:YjgB family protein [Anaerobacillus sp. CMMVII]MCT8137717.1 DUF4309 domain-containing protein [Anaerobacillus sp. CMMVII]
MKKTTILIFLLSFLVGCSNDLTPLDENVKQTASIQTNQLDPYLQKQNDTWIDRMVLEQNSHFSFRVKARENEDYVIFVLESDHSYRLALLKEGEDQGLVEEDIEVFFPDESLVLSRSFQPEQFLVFMQADQTGLNMAELFYVADGRIEWITKNTKLFFSDTNIKLIKENTFQTVSYNGDEWKFTTWELKNNKLHDIDATLYNNTHDPYGLLKGEYWFEIWNETPEMFLAYQDLELTKGWIAVAAMGQMVGSPVAIGDSKQKLVEELGQPFEEGYYEGGPYFGYSNFMFIFDEAEKITHIAMNGNRIKKTLNEVKEIVGKPDKEGFNEMTEEVFFQYTVGNYLLKFNANPHDGMVVDVWVYER